MPPNRALGPRFDTPVGHANGRRGRSCFPLFLLVALGVLAAPAAAAAQQTPKTPRIGVLGGVSPEASPAPYALPQGLRELGYVEGQNIALEWRWARGRAERFPELAAELVALKVDVIVAGNSAAISAAKNATGTIPIIMVLATDPVGEGFVTGFARPGGNITGLTINAGPEIFGKHLELLKEAVPKASRVAVLWNPNNPTHHLALRETERAARALRVKLQILEARKPDDFDSAFSAMTRERAGALLVLPEALFVLHRTRIADLAARSRLPAVYGLREHAEVGGLMSYGASLPGQWRRAATYVDKILKGAKPADLPVEQPTRFELVINLKTAKALGLTIPPSVLIRADQVIQ